MQLLSSFAGSPRITLPPTIQHELVLNRLKMSARQMAAFNVFEYKMLRNYLKTKFKMTALRTYPFMLQAQSCVWNPTPVGQFSNNELELTPVKANAEQCLDEFFSSLGVENPFAAFVRENGGEWATTPETEAFLTQLARRMLETFNDSLMLAYRMGNYTSFSDKTFVSTMPTNQQTRIVDSLGQFDGYVKILTGASGVNDTALLEVADLGANRKIIPPDKALEVALALKDAASEELRALLYTEVEDSEGNRLSPVFIATPSYYAALQEFMHINEGTTADSAMSVTMATETVNGYTGQILRVNNIPVVVDPYLGASYNYLSSHVFHALILTYSRNITLAMGINGNFDEAAQVAEGGMFTEIPMAYPVYGQRAVSKGDAVAGVGVNDYILVTSAINEFASA